MKVAIVHDWLVNYGGAESVVETILKIFPDADIFTLVHDKEKMRGRFEKNKIYTSSLQKIPCATKFYTKFLKFMPRAFESFDFSEYDLVISSSSSCAKGVITPPYVPHIAYIHTPMRYAWDLFFDYRKRSGTLTRFFMDMWMTEIRQWDFISAQRIDTIIANSSYIARRIKKFWGRDSSIIYPPVDVEKFSCTETPRENFYVAFSRLVPYKKIDLAISACGEMGKRLVVIGSGSEEKKLHALASSYKNADIKFLGRASDEEVRQYLQRCRALIFCAEEDFGIVPVEAQACGAPVIAFGRGGACETVIDGKTGVFFSEQNVEALKDATTTFESMAEKGVFDSTEIRAHAKNFCEERFIDEFKAAVEETQKKISTAGNHSDDEKNIIGGK